MKIFKILNPSPPPKKYLKILVKVVLTSGIRNRAEIKKNTKRKEKGGPEWLVIRVKEGKLKYFRWSNCQRPFVRPPENLKNFFFYCFWSSNFKLRETNAILHFCNSRRKQKKNDFFLKKKKGKRWSFAKLFYSSQKPVKNGTAEKIEKLIKDCMQYNVEDVDLKQKLTQLKKIQRKKTQKKFFLG